MPLEEWKIERLNNSLEDLLGDFRRNVIFNEKESAVRKIRKLTLGFLGFYPEIIKLVQDADIDYCAKVWRAAYEFLEDCTQWASPLAEKYYDCVDAYEALNDVKGRVYLLWQTHTDSEET
ncbi:hypothetical protein HYZ97_04250 [Candidatus Pacearchaeota archaeon]|nr:hypothetical protein [Candidatus Pacearchaeota archaeon]